MKKVFVSLLCVFALLLAGCAQSSPTVLVAELSGAVDVIVIAIETSCIAHSTQCITPAQQQAVHDWAKVASDATLQIVAVLQKKEVPAQEANDIITVVQNLLASAPVNLPPAYQADINAAVSIGREIIALYQVISAANTPIPGAIRQANTGVRETITMPSLSFSERRKLHSIQSHQTDVHKKLVAQVH